MKYVVNVAKYMVSNKVTLVYNESEVFLFCKVKHIHLFKDKIPIMYVIDLLDEYKLLKSVGPQLYQSQIEKKLVKYFWYFK